VVPSVPPALAAVVAKAMAREPGNRYQSAADMAEDLTRAWQDCRPGSQSSVDGVTNVPTSGNVEPLSHPARRLSIFAAVLASVALLATAFAAVCEKVKAPPPDSSQFVAVVPFVNESGDPDAAGEGAGFAEAITATLEGLSSVSLLSRPAAQYLPSSGDARKDVRGSGVTRLVTGKVGGPPTAREYTVRIERAGGKVVSTRTYRAGSKGMSAIQSNAVRDIVAGLGVALTTADADRLKQGPPCRPETYRDIARGRALLEREDLGGNPGLAETTFRGAAASDPSCAMAYAGLADACWARYRAEHAAALASAASDAIAKACELDPVNPTIRLSLARVYANTGRPKQAEETVRQVIGRRPTDDEPHRLLSDILDDQDRTEEASAEFERATALRPNNVINYLVRGIRHYNTGRYEEALASFQRVLKIQPDNEWATINTIAAHAMIGNFQQAIDVYEASPVKNATMRSNLGSIYVALNRCAEAAAVTREAVEMAPRDDVKRRNLGDAYACLGRPSEAAREYREAVAITRELLRVNKADTRALARRALYEAKCGLKAEALEHVDEALRLSPNDKEVLYKAAAVHSLLKQPTEAVERLRQALEKGYSRTQARLDRDLNPIRQLPDVQQMLGAAGR